MAIDREKILQVAQKLVDKKRYDKAIEEYHKLVADDPGDVRTLLKIGDLHLKLDAYEHAIATYEQVGEHYYREGFSVKAIAVYKQIRGIIRRHAQHLENRYGHIVPRLAEIYTQLGLTSDALAAYDEVATRLRQEGRERDALDIFKKVLDLDPQNPIAHLRVADSRARLGDIDKAVDAFGEAARIMLRLERFDDAIKVLERLLEYRQDAEYARMCGQTYLLRAGPHDGMTALSKLQVAFKANPKDLETLSVLARAFDAINQPRKSVEVLKEAARIAREKNDEAALERIMTTLLERAPDDAAIQRLQDQLGSPLAPAAGPAAAPVAPGPAPTLQEPESIDEVFELGESDLHSVGSVPEVANASDLFAPDTPDAEGSDVRRLVRQAEAHRVAGRLPQAIQLMRNGLHHLGSSKLMRHKLADLLLEGGDLGAAIGEKLVLAYELATEVGPEAALPTLDEVLLLHPGHPDALAMRQQLGFPAPPSHAEQGIEDLQLDQPLQSYDVESGGIDEVLHRSSHASFPQLDDPFAEHQYAPPPGYEAPPMAELRAGPPSTRVSLDESALEHAEQLADQGRFDEARMVLNQQLQLLPNHPLVLDRLADLDALAAGAAAQSGPYPAQPSSGPLPPSSGYAMPSPLPQAGYPQAPPAPAPAGPYPAAAEFMSQSRADLRSQVAEGDAQTHYDLGVAYMEMGLHTDAINALTLAMRDRHRECVCLSMIGTIYLQVGDLDAGLDSLHRALNTQHKTRDQELALGYEIANTYELKGMAQQALHYFDWLARLDPQYQEPRGSLSERIHRLRVGSGPQPRPVAPPSGDTGALDRAMDDIIKSR